MTGEPAKNGAPHNLLKVRIFTYAPMQEGRKHIALIAGLNIVFYGDTPMQAHIAADEWRKIEYEKLTSKSKRKTDAEAEA